MSTLKVLLTLSLVSSAGAAMAASGLPGEFDEFHVSLCNAKNVRCVSVHAAHASGTVFKQLLSLNDVRVQTLKNGGATETKLETWPQGYVDLELKRVVVWQVERGQRREKVFAL